VIVWRIDRLGRSLIDVLNTVELLRSHGVHVRSLSDGIDPTTSTGRLMLHMLATLVEYERELIVERVNAGITAARESDRRFESPPMNPTPSRRSSPSSPRPAVVAARPPRRRRSSAGAARRYAGTRPAQRCTRCSAAF